MCYFVLIERSAGETPKENLGGAFADGESRDNGCHGKNKPNTGSDVAHTEARD